MFRAAHHNIDLSLPIYPYNGKDEHYDLMTHLNQISNLSMLDSDYSLKYISLKKWMNYFGLGTKLSIKEGEIEIRKAFYTDQTALEEYCKSDVIATYEIWKRFRGNFKQPWFLTKNTRYES
jgi:hypothetical protein